MFTQKIECLYCSQTRNLVEEMATLNPKVTTKIYDFKANADKAKEYGIERTPTIAVIGKTDYSVRIYGIPFGYELQTLIKDIVNA